MKRIISAMLTFVTLLSMCSFPIFANEGEIVFDALHEEHENTQESFDDGSDYPSFGTEASVGNKLYYILDGTLYCSEDSGRPSAVCDGAFFVIESDGVVYYAVAEGYNTCIYNADNGEMVTKLFVPIDCFDVEGEYVYYSYNGEVTKLNTQTLEEEVAAVGGTKLFCVENGEMKDVTVVSSEKVSNEFSSESLVSLSDIYAGTVEPCTISSNYNYSKKNITIPVYTLNGKYFKPYMFMTIPNVTYCNIGKVDKSGNKNDVWYRFGPVNGGGGIYNTFNKYYIREQDVINNFTKNDPTGSALNWAYEYHSYGNITFSEIKCISTGNHSYATIRNKNENVIDVGTCRYCGHKFDYLSPSAFTTSSAGTYVRKSSEKDSSYKLYFRDEPYEDAAPTTLKVKNIDKLQIDGHTRNAYDNKWYKISAYYNNGKKVSKALWMHYSHIDNNFDAPSSSGGNNTSGGGRHDISTEYISYNSGKVLYLEGRESTVNISPDKHPAGGDVVLLSDFSTPEGCIYQGRAFNLTGKMTSDYYITNAMAEVCDATTGRVVCSAEFNGSYANVINIEKTNLNYGIKFNTLPVGSYYLVYTASDTSMSEPTVWVSPVFKVIKQSQNVSPRPSIAITNIANGQRATVTCSDGSALIRVSTNGKEYTGYSSVTVDFIEAGNFPVIAWTSKNNCIDSPSAVASVSVAQVSAPTINEPSYGNDVKVTISGDGDIYYTLDGSAPTENSAKYTAPLSFNKAQNITIKAISTKHGYATSDVAEKAIVISAPDAPAITMSNAEKIAQGETASVSWKKVDKAVSYTAYLMRDEEVVKKVDTTDTKAVFAMDEYSDTENFEYSIHVVARNSIGDSENSNSLSVWAMHPVIVKFVDKMVRENDVTDEIVAQVQENIDNHNVDDYLLEGNVISVQKISYNTRASKPITPSKKGCTFAGYGENMYYNVTEDIIIDVLYELNSYSVQLWNSYTSAQIGNTHEIFYSCSVDLPEDVVLPPYYILAGWNVDITQSDAFDFTYVEGDMMITTVFAWENPDLPAAVDIAKVQRAEDSQSYTVDVICTNNNLENTHARLIIALYTYDGRMVYTQTEDIEMKKASIGKSETRSVQLSYNHPISKATAVMVQVNENITGGAISEMDETTDIIFPDATSGFWGAWSEWTEAPLYADDDTQVEVKYQYRYKDKEEKTTNNTKNLDGWNYLKTDSYTKSEVYNGKNHVDEVSTDALLRKVRTNYVAPVGKDQWRYGRLRNSSGSWSHYCPTVYTDYGYCTIYNTTEWQDTRVAPSLTNYYYCGGTSSAHVHYWPAATINGVDYWNKYRVNGLTYYWEEYRWLQTGGGYTEYWYTDTTYTHHFWKWNDNWSEWSDTEYTANGDRLVEKREMYRSREFILNFPDYDPSLDKTLEENTLITYEISGTLSGIAEDFSGKKATVLVYKKLNSDPTQEQLEYVDQIEIGEGNSYSIVVNPRQVADTTTGDFIVTMALEGSERLSYVDIIYAPVETYTVTFRVDGEVYGEPVSVAKNRGVDVNVIGIPEKDGYRFVKWDKSLVNITKNLSVSAVFEPVRFTVAYVDHENETVELYDLEYGAPLAHPAVKAVEGKEFVGWNKVLEGITTVNGGMVVTAKWNTLQHNVTFCNFNNEVISVQPVFHGESAILPPPVIDGGMLYQWDVNGGTWWNVTEDMTIFPYKPVTAVVCAPMINTSTEEVGGIFFAELSTAQNGGRIFYSINDEITEAEAEDFVFDMYYKNEAELSFILSSVDDDEIFEENSQKIIEYTESLEISDGTIVYAFTIDENGNISPISVFEFGYDTHYDESATESTFELPEDSPQIILPDIAVSKGETVTVPVELKNNVGMSNLSIVIGYSETDFVLKEVVNGDVFEDIAYAADIRDDGTCKITWNASEESVADGTLVHLVFEVINHDVKAYITAAVTEITSTNCTEQPYAVKDSNVKTATAVASGDTNGDGYTDFSDAILVLKHDVGLITLTPAQLECSDVNGDGDVDFSDAILILKYDVGLIENFDR